jgi:hypothetical protein
MAEMYEVYVGFGDDDGFGIDRGTRAGDDRGALFRWFRDTTVRGEVLELRVGLADVAQRDHTGGCLVALRFDGQPDSFVSAPCRVAAPLLVRFVGVGAEEFAECGERWLVLPRLGGCETVADPWTAAS